MTKWHVTTQAVIFGLCLLGAGFVLGSYDRISMETLKGAVAALPSLLAGAGILLFLYRTAKNASLVKWLAGEEPEPVTKSADTRTLAGALRLAAVSAGLILLAANIRAVWEALNTAVFFIRSGREFFQSIVEGDYSLALDQGLSGLKTLLYPIGLCGWIAYLLTGAEKLVFRQVRSTSLKTDQGEMGS
jgi:vacuolar-type H+-ATPase subunit I/STV1